MTKQQVRRMARERWRQFSPAELRQMGEAMSKVTASLTQWQQAKEIFCFVSMKNEPDTFPLLRSALRQNKRLLVPRVLPDVKGGMELAAVSDLAQLQPQGVYGILEPVGGEVVPLGSLSSTALAVIPCLAADQNGVRLGRGGGYYDRFLEHYKGNRILLCPSALLFDELPRNAWDAVFAPEEILTEKGFILRD